MMMGGRNERVNEDDVDDDVDVSDAASSTAENQNVSSSACAWMHDVEGCELGLDGVTVSNQGDQPRD